MKQLINTDRSCEIYTDGSKDRGSNTVGLAVVCPSLDIKIQRKLDPNTSVFTAECMAINEAMDIALKKLNHTIYIFTDSLSILTSLKNCSFNIRVNPYLLEIKKKYANFMKNKYTGANIKFYWIPSHHGIQGNEAADSLAKDARNKDDDSGKIDIPFTDLKDTFKDSMFYETNEMITKIGLTKGAFYFKNYYKTSRKAWFYKHNVFREIIVSINRLRADHYHLAASLARVNILNSPKCKCQEYDEDIDHVVWQCTLYNHERCELLQQLFKLNLRLPMKMSLLLTEPNANACRYVIMFLKKYKLTV